MAIVQVSSKDEEEKQQGQQEEEEEAPAQVGLRPPWSSGRSAGYGPQRRAPAGHALLAPP